MCEPTTMMLVAGGGAVTDAVGTGVQAYGQWEQAKAESSAMRENARRLRLEAADSIARGLHEGGQARTAGTKVIGEQRAAIGASGVDVGSASASQLYAESRMNSELDAQTIQNNAAREAYGKREAADDLVAQAKRRLTAGKYQVAGTILSGVSSAAGKVYGMGKG